ncbi:MAG: response regulator [Bacteroidales bacterium]|nr:response regulator [Bacteroidales bacterium]
MNINNYIEKFLPEKVMYDEELQRKSILFIKASILSIVFLLIYTLFYFLLSYTLPALLCLSMALIASFTVILFIKKEGYWRCASIFSSISLIGLWLIAASTGNIYSPTLPWLVVSPIFAFIFSNRKSGILYTVLMFLCVFLLLLNNIYHIIKLPFYNYKEDLILYSFVYSGLMVYFITLIFFVYEKGYKVLFSSLKVANLLIEDKASQIEIKNRELVIEREKAEQSSRAKAQFLSSMSHEIRTPMNTVIGMTHLLLQENPKPEQIENLNILKFSAENLLALINDILDFSKIEAGKIEIENIDFNFRDLLNGIMHTHTQRVNEKNIQIELSIDDEIPDMLISDPTRLFQILNNIIGNAVKFTDKGKISVDIFLEKNIEDKFLVKFIIEDTGVGISKDKISEIFDQFTQANTDIARRFGGSGLGLAITKSLLKLMKSDIFVESEEGRGTKFYFSLLFAKSNIIINKSLNIYGEKQNFFNLEGTKVLVVEDNHSNQVIAGKFLAKWGVNFEIAENGKIAFDLLSKGSYDLVLLDLQMPVMDGYELIALLRSSSNEKLKKIPVIALTASAMLDVLDRLKDIGFNDYITKPFIPIELNKKIKKWTKMI